MVFAVYPTLVYNLSNYIGGFLPLKFYLRPLFSIAVTLVMMYSILGCMASTLTSSDERIRSLILVGARKVACHTKVEGKTYFESEPISLEAAEVQAEIFSAKQLCSMCLGNNKTDIAKLWGEPTLKSQSINKRHLDKAEKMIRKWSIGSSSDTVDKWFYLLGQSRVPVELSFNQQRCDSARIATKGDFEDAQSLIIRQIARGVERSPSQVRRLLGEPDRVVTRRGATNWVYSVDALFDVELIFVNGKCIGFEKTWKFDS